MPLRIMPLGIMPLRIMPLRIIPLGKMPFGIKAYDVTIKNAKQHGTEKFDIQHNNKIATISITLICDTQHNNKIVRLHNSNATLSITITSDIKDSVICAICGEFSWANMSIMPSVVRLIVVAPIVASRQ